MKQLDQILTLTEAAELLGVAQSTLRNQVKRERLAARLIGKTWVTTRDEVERYRRDSLGNVGRPRGMAEGFRILGFRPTIVGEPNPCAVCAEFRGRTLDSNSPDAPDLPLAGCTAERGCTCRYE